MGSDIFFFSVQQVCFSHGPTNGVHILDLVLESAMFFSRNVCRMREQLCQIDHSDSIAWMPSRGSVVSVLSRVIRFTLCLPSLPGFGRCLARQQIPHTSWPPQQPNWWWGSQGLVAGRGGSLEDDSRASRSNGSYYGKWFHNVPQVVAVMGLERLSMHESRSYNKPSALRLILAWGYPSACVGFWSSRMTTLIVLPECLRGDLWVMFLPRVIRLTLCLPSLPGLGRCVAHQQNHHNTLPQRQPDWRWGSQGLVAAAGGSLEDHREHRDPMELFQWFRTCNHDEFGAQSK